MKGGKLIVFSAPSGSGKTTIVQHLLKQEKLICEVEWPKPDVTFLNFEQVIVGVQVNGKLRGKINYNKNISQDEIERLALSLDIVKNYLDGKHPKKIIVVPERIVNIVI